MNRLTRPGVHGGRITRSDALERARKLFLTGERVDMQALAADLGIGRATLYRWVGDRDMLLAHTILSIMAPPMERVAQQSSWTLSGRDRVLSIMEEMGNLLLGFAPFTAFLRREPIAAMRILTTQATPVQTRTIAFIERILGEEIAAGAMRIPDNVDTHTLAYATLRLAESFYYADIVAGMHADVKAAIPLIALLLSDTAP